MENLIQFGVWIDDPDGDPNEARPATKEQVLEAIGHFPKDMVAAELDQVDDGVFLIACADHVWNKLESEDLIEYTTTLASGDIVRLEAEMP